MCRALFYFKNLCRDAKLFCTIPIHRYIPVEAGLIVEFQDFQECFLWDLHISNLPHFLLSFLLFFQQFPFSGNIPTITLSGYVFSKGRNGFPFRRLQILRPKDSALSRWTSADKASTLSPFNLISILTRSDSRYSIG